MNEPRTVAEAYCRAANASSLLVKAEVRGSADVLIAAGWSKPRVGSALMRLYSEYDGASHPKTATAADGNGDKKKAIARNQNEAVLLFMRLKSIAGVREQVSIQAKAFGLHNPDDIARAVTRWWLSHACGGCNGTRFEVIGGTGGRQSGRNCRECRGEGVEPIPHGENGKKMVNWMEDCLSCARQQIKQRLRGRAAAQDAAPERRVVV